MVVRLQNLALILGFAVTACSGGGDATSTDGDSTPPPDDGFDRSALLADLGEDVVVPTYRAFDSDVDELVVAVAAYCDALGGDGEAAALETSRQAWRDAMVSWQRAEVMLFGPAAMNENTLRDRVYSWPLVSSCAVDQDVNEKRLDSGFDISTRLTNRRGLDALEYLLFADSLEHTCPSQAAPEGWAGLADDERRAARCAYAADATADLAVQSQTIIDAWAPEAGNYLADFVGAGTEGSSFDSAQEAINVVSDALFYVDDEIKDMKLGATTGITDNSCNTPQAPCFDDLESPYANHSLENLIANMEGVQLVFLSGAPGQDGVGFDDFLTALNAGDLATSMAGELESALTLAGELSGTLRSSLEDDYDGVVAVHSAIKVFNDDLKTQFLTILGLDIPEAAAGDND